MPLKPLKKLLVYTFCLAISILVYTSAYSQKGTIQGVVIDKLRSETLVGAAVYIPGTSTGTTTDFDGNFALANLTPGVYNIQVSFISYTSVIIENIKVEANKASTVKVELEEVSTALEGVVVSAVRKTNTDMALVSTIKASPIVASGISAQQITRSQDRDASEVVRRIPGISIIGDKFIVIRGLNQRYNNVWVNNASTPSTEADQKAFSFDQIPSYMIDNVIIAKSPSPDLPADFAGGFVSIFTKNMPEKDFLRVSYGSSFNDGTTLQEFNLTPGGKYEWLGIEDGTRSLPDNFPKTLKGLSSAKLAEHGLSLNNNWDAEPIAAIPNQSISINYGKKFQKGNRSIGTITALNYSLSHNSDDVINNGYQSARTDGINPDYNYNYLDNIYSRTAKVGLLHNWAFFPGKNKKIEFRNMLNLIGKNQSTIRNGFYGYEGRTIRYFENAFMNRLTYSGQLNAEYKFGENKNKIDWNAGVSYANRNEPDLKRIRTTLNEDLGSPYDGLYFASIGISPSASDAGRLFMRLDEIISSAGVNYETNFSIFNISAMFKTGAFAEYKQRDFDARLLGFAKNSPNPQSVWITPLNALFSDENINTTAEGFTLRETTSKSDSYFASNLNIAGYSLLKFVISQRFTVYGGIRVEQNNQHLESYDRYNQPIEVKKDVLGIFPSVNMSFNLNEKNVIRAAYGVTTNRPEFREIAPFYFYNFQQEADFVGNVNLNDSKIQNFDLRYEFYPNAGETFSLGVFYKQFKNPIEVKYVSAGNRNNYSYGNANSATSLGAEMELRISLESIPVLHNFSVVSNAAYIFSKVHFNDDFIERDRAMQGQSPYLANFGLFYSSEKSKVSASILYNIIGSRIAFTGEAKQSILDDIPDIYEKHHHLIDFTISKEFGKHYEVKVGVKDILNHNIVFYSPYASVTGGEKLEKVNQQWSTGRTYSLSFSINF